MSFIDTLRTAFKGSDGARVPLARSFTSPWSWAYEQGGNRPPYEYQRAVRESFLSNPVAQRAVRIVAEGVGSAPLRNIEGSAGAKKAAKLVNATCAGQPLLETLAAHLLLHGNAYVQIMRDGSDAPIELFALRPDRVSVQPDASGWPAAYLYKVGDKTVTIPIDDQDGWPSVIHIKSFHPTDDHYGAGCLSAAEQAVGIHNAAAEWNRALLENAARPSGALVFDGGKDTAGLTGDQFDRLKGELSHAFSGGKNAGRPLLLEGGLKWQSMSMSPADMDFAELKAAAARDIALAFGVPPMLLGLPGDNTYANYKEANRALWRLTLLPLSAKILGGIAEGLRPWFADLELAIDLDRVPALAEDRGKVWAQVSAADFLGDDEKRAMLGIAPKGGAS